MPQVQRIYIAGPMSGMPELNYPAFNQAAAQLRHAGHHVENPAENPAPACGTWLGYMRLAIAQLVTCDRIHLLPGWSGSKGANTEYALAKSLDLLVTLAEGAESSPRETLYIYGRRYGLTTAHNAGADLAIQQAIERCQEIADGQESLRIKNLDSNGEATEASVAHGNKWLGAFHCVEAIRMLAKRTTA